MRTGSKTSNGPASLSLRICPSLSCWIAVGAHCLRPPSVSFVVLFLCLQLQAPAFAVDSNFKQGMQSYKKKDYNAALKLLKKSSAADPYNAEIHYYLANCHIFLNDGESAMKEYSQCFDLEPLSTFGQYSRQALLAFGKKFKGLYTQAPDGKKHVYPDDPKSIKQALALIKDQTCEREKLHHDTAETAAKTAVDAGEERNHRINKKAEELAEDITPTDRPPSPEVQLELHEIQQKAVFEGQRAKLNAQQEATKHMTHAAERSTNIENSANSLLSLISEKPKPGRIKVKAAGTNLYVRNYDFEPAPPIEPLVATWESLVQEGETPPALRRAIKTKAIVKSKAVSANSKKAISSLKNESVETKKEIAPAKPKSLNGAFMPGSSKVVVTDHNGRVLLHIRDDGNK